MAVFDFTQYHALIALFKTTAFFLVVIDLLIGALEYSKPTFCPNIFFDDFSDISVDGLENINGG